MPTILPSWQHRTNAELAVLAADVKAGRVLGSWMLTSPECDHVFRGWFDLVTLIVMQEKGALYLSSPAAAKHMASLPMPAHYFAYVQPLLDNTSSTLPRFDGYDILSSDEWDLLSGLLSP